MKDVKTSLRRKHSKKLHRAKSQVDESLCLSYMVKEEKGIVQSLKRRKKIKKNRTKMHLDEASQLQRRARYLLVKLRLEQSLIDAYSGEGWKGQSMTPPYPWKLYQLVSVRSASRTTRSSILWKENLGVVGHDLVTRAIDGDRLSARQRRQPCREKIRPEKELQRAKMQILNCKLGIRDVIYQLHLLSSSGQIDESLIFPDGSIHHDHIYCAKCKLMEASEDNDIILCDGTCNCAFHQKCLDPPLATKDIPSGDLGWFCKFCDCKLDILEAMNAHLGTQFSGNDTWQDIFKEALPNDESAVLEEWADEDSKDNDYDPLTNEDCDYLSTSSRGNNMDGQSSSNSSSSLEEETYSEFGCSLDVNDLTNGNHEMDANTGLNTDETIDYEIMSAPRRRYAVDYRKLYVEMFGKDPAVAEQLSEDEDWDPSKRKQRETKGSALVTSFDSKGGSELHMVVEESCAADLRPRKHIKRIPADAVEKLRQVFVENELPSKAIKLKISQQLSLKYEKVNKWFKNARYISLRTKRVDIDLKEGISLKRHLSLLKAKKRRKNVRLVDSKQAEQLMERLYQIETKLWRLKQLMWTFTADKMNLKTTDLAYIPVAELKQNLPCASDGSGGQGAGALAHGTDICIRRS